MSLKQGIAVGLRYGTGFAWTAVGELSVLIKRRHPEVQAEVDRVYQERLAKLVKGGDPAAQDDWLFSVGPRA
jgi:hypothetical protein